MDAITKLLMEKYGLTPEQAEVMAAKIRGSDLNPDNRLKVEALKNTIEPHVQRAKRIAYFNELNARFESGGELDEDEYAYLEQVKAAEQKRLQSQSQAMVAGRKLSTLIAPHLAQPQVNLQVGQAEALPTLELGPAQVNAPQIGLELGPAQVAPDFSSQLAMWDDPAAVSRRASNPDFWNSPRGQARVSEMEALRYWNTPAGKASLRNK